MSDSSSAQRFDPEALFTAAQQLPVRRQVVVMNDQPGIEELLLGRSEDLAVQFIAVEIKLELFTLIDDVDVGMWCCPPPSAYMRTINP